MHGRNASRVRPSRDSGTPDAATTLELLAEAGLPVIPTRRASAVDEVLAAAAEVGYPVALKTTAADHKTEVGGVRARARGPGSGRRGVRPAERARRRGPRPGDGAVPASSSTSASSATRTSARSSCSAPGGVLVELVAERVVALPPLREDAALAMLDELPKVGRLLDGYRGAAPADRRALARAVATRLRASPWPGTAPTQPGVTLDALDVNPLLCTPTGVLALDALLADALRTAAAARRGVRQFAARRPERRQTQHVVGRLEVAEGHEDRADTPSSPRAR